MNTRIDQWEVLGAVVRLGSFAAAATKICPRSDVAE